MRKINTAKSEVHAALLGDLEDHQLDNTEEKLRLRREYVNEAIEMVGYNLKQIEQYLIKKHVA